jgi:hypothetical protein
MEEAGRALAAATANARTRLERHAALIARVKIKAGTAPKARLSAGVQKKSQKKEGSERCAAIPLGRSSSFLRPVVYRGVLRLQASGKSHPMSTSPATISADSSIFLSPLEAPQPRRAAFVVKRHNSVKDFCAIPEA